MSRTNILESNEWVNEFLKKMPRDEQVKWLTEKFTLSLNEKTILDILGGLEMLFDDEVTFRKHLRDACRELGVLNIPIVKKILEGWNWRWDNACFSSTPEDYRGINELVKKTDAEDCFIFFCESYQKADEGLKEMLISALHHHINFYKREYSGTTCPWNPEDLNEWILKGYVPEEIAKVLTKVRASIGNATFIHEEVSLTHTFQTQARSKEAVAIAMAYLENLKRTEELADELLFRIGPHNNRGDFNSWSEVGEFLGKVEWKLESEQVICFQVAFFRPTNKEKALKYLEAYPAIISKMQASRDKLLKDAENPPHIFLEAWEEEIDRIINRQPIPDGFSFSERS